MKPTYWLCATLSMLCGKALFSLRIIGKEKIPRKGPAILAMNHMSFLDPPFTGGMVDGEIHYLARKTLMSNAFMKWLLPRLNVIPVDRDGQDRTALKIVIKALADGHRVLLFPEGTRSHDGNLQPAKAGIGLIAAKSCAPIVPIRIFGSGDAMPRTGGVRLFTPVTLVVGDPIPGFDDSKADRERYQEISNQVMAAIGALNLPGR